jgi:hypothetical protein
MFDLFTKSRVEAPPDQHMSWFDQAPGLKNAWRIALAINDALKVAEAERRILTCRVNDAVSRSAVTLGNGTDEYLERESLDTLHLDRFDAEIRDKNEYLVRFEQNIGHLKLLKGGLLAAFPEIDRGSVIPR